MRAWELSIGEKISSSIGYFALVPMAVSCGPIRSCFTTPSLVGQKCQIEWPPPTDFVVINVTCDAIVRGSLGRISHRVMAFAAFHDGGHEHVGGLGTSSRERVTCSAVFPTGWQLLVRGRPWA